MKSMEQDSDAILYMCTFGIRAVGNKHLPCLLEVAWFRRPPIPIPSSKLHAHNFRLRFCHSLPCSAPIKHLVDFRDVRLVVHHPAAEFDPCVSLEGHLLG